MGHNRAPFFGIPTMWLVDKRGNLRDTDAQFDLERREYGEGESHLLLPVRLQL